MPRPDRRVALGRRHEDGFAGDGPGAMKGVIVAITEEHEPVEGVGASCDMPYERRARRALAIKPRELVADGMGPFEDDSRVPARMFQCRGHATTGKRRTVTPLIDFDARPETRWPT